MSKDIVLMETRWKREIVALANDNQSTASQILPRVLSVLREVLGSGGVDLESVGRGLCMAQPAMASVWNAVGIALKRSESDLNLFEQRLKRASHSMSRLAVEVFAPGASKDYSNPLVVVTYSASRSVAACLTALADQRELTVACSEGRPMLEGRSMAKFLVQSDLEVRFFTDSGLGTALEGSEALIIGADAVSSDWTINKCGTYQLAAAAMDCGIPVYTVASRDKFIAPCLANLLSCSSGSSDEIWTDAPTDVTVCNPYFEKIPLRLITAVISDLGVLIPDMLADACIASGRNIHLSAFEKLIKGE